MMHQHDAENIRRKGFEHQVEAAELGVADLLGRTETLVMGSAAASVLAWWALGFAVKSLERGVGRRFDETRKRDER